MTPSWDIHTNSGYLISDAMMMWCLNRLFPPLCPTKIKKWHFSLIFTTFHIPGGSPPGVWYLASDITTWSQACLHCQQAKIHRHIRLQPQPVPIPQGRFSHLHINLVGPLQYSGGFNFIFTLIDHTSKWMEAVPLYDTSAAAWAKALIFSWISLFGVPEMITSDHGTQFTSNIWSHLCEMLHNSHCQTTAY